MTDMEGPEKNKRRIVLLGKTGSGKSSLANTLFGEITAFKVGHCRNSETKCCMSKTKTVNGRSIQLIDTPGFFDTDPGSPEVSPEILKCLVACAPGPHAFLLVLKAEKFTLHEQAVVDVILECFSEEALKYTTVVFTHGDQLDERMKIEEWVGQNEDLRNLVQKCGGRCHVFDNKYWNNCQDQYRNNQYQIEQLLQTIDQTVRENGGGHYTIELLQKVQEEVEEATKKIIQSNPTLPLRQIIQKAKDAFNKEMIISVTKRCLSKPLVGTIVGPVGTAVRAVAGTAVGAAIGAAVEARKWLLNLF